MITTFNDNEARKSGIIYRSTFNQIKKMYDVNPEQAGELAISAIELVLTGDISSDDALINLILEQNKEINQKNANDYDNKVEQARRKKIIDQKLDEIARLHNAGSIQREIAVKLGLSQQTVSNRLALIRKEYPELLQDKNACTSAQAKNTKVDKNACIPIQDENACTSKKELVQDKNACTSPHKFVQDSTSLYKVVQEKNTCTSNNELVQDVLKEFKF